MSEERINLREVFSSLGEHNNICYELLYKEITLEYEVGIEESISKTSVTPRSARPAYGVRLQTPAFTLGELKLTQERDTTRMVLEG